MPNSGQHLINYNEWYFIKIQIQKIFIQLRSKFEWMFRLIQRANVDLRDVAVFAKTGSCANLPIHRVVFRVWHHIRAMRDAVGVVEETNDIAKVEYSLVGQALLAEDGTITVSDLIRRHGQLPCKVEHRSLMRGQLGDAIVHYNDLTQLRVF